jgi:hypothetical protein
MKLKPTETLYLFVREQRKLMTPSKCIEEYVKEAGDALGGVPGTLG